jgi:hypothetical protein
MMRTLKMMNSDEKIERFMSFTIADCVELVSLVGYVKFMEAFQTALLTKKNSLPLSQEELEERQKHLWNEWKY